MRVLGISFFLMGLTAGHAQQFIQSGATDLASIGEGTGTSQFISCSCAQRIINKKTLVSDPACANFERAGVQAMATPGSVATGNVPASPFGLQH